MNYILPISTSFSIISSILLFIINPGIVYSDGDIQNENEKIYCPACQFFYPKNLSIGHLLLILLFKK